MFKPFLSHNTMTHAPHLGSHKDLTREGGSLQREGSFTFTHRKV